MATYDEQTIKHLRGLLKLAEEGLRSIAQGLVPENQFVQIAHNTLKSITPIKMDDETPLD